MPDLEHAESDGEDSPAVIAELELPVLGRDFNILNIDDLRAAGTRTMPELDDTESDGEESATTNAAAHQLPSLLASGGRDFLIRNNGDQVKISELNGKIVGLFFSASWCRPGTEFTPELAETYCEISSQGFNFEIVFVSADDDEESFNLYFSNMPWLAVPFSDADTRDRLNSSFNVFGIPHLVILDADRRVLWSDGVGIVRDYGAEGFPFTGERIRALEEEDEAARKNHTLGSLLVSPSRDFVISSKDKTEVPISDLEGKVVGLYFSSSSHSHNQSVEFKRSLDEMYLKLKEKGENFEVVQVNVDDSQEGGSDGMLWLAIPSEDKKTCKRLVRHFNVDEVPTLVVFSSDGKIQQHNAVEFVEDYGIDVYPFTPTKLAEMEEKEKAMRATQTLESILVSRELDYVVGKDGIVIPVSELVGRNVMLYFSAQSSPPCRAFLPKLIEAYHEIKEKDAAFGIIFVSGDPDESSFDEHFSEMPWLALPFGDGRRRSLMRSFHVHGVLSLVAVGPDGKTTTAEAKELVMAYGGAAYPFTEERRRELEAEIEEMAKAWPEKMKHELHEHELVKCCRDTYHCDECGKVGAGWSFYCAMCDFDLDPKCALEGDEVTRAAGVGEEKPRQPEGMLQ